MSVKIQQNQQGKFELSSDINVITAEINSYKQVAGQAIFEIGRRLKHVKENDLVHGEWTRWCEETLNLTVRSAQRYVKVYDRYKTDTTHVSHLPLGILNELTPFDDDELDKLRELPDGSTKKLTEMTRREIEDFKRREAEAIKEKEIALHAAEEANKRVKEAEDYNKLVEEELESERLKRELTEHQLKREQDKKKPEVQIETRTVEVEKIVEVDKTDYSTLKKLNSSIEDLKQESDHQKRQLEIKRREAELYKDDAAKYKEIKENMAKISQTNEDVSRQIESATSISGLVVEIEHILMGKLAPVKYSRAISEQIDNPVVIKNVEEIVDRVRSWCDEMNSLVGKNNFNGRVVVDGVVVESELV